MVLMAFQVQPLTSNGVQHMFDFWLGDKGFGPFLEKKVREGDQWLIQKRSNAFLLGPLLDNNPIALLRY